MQVVLKWVAQFLLVPLLKDLGEYLVNKYKESIELKRIKKENELRVKAYEATKTVDEAVKEFEKLP